MGDPYLIEPVLMRHPKLRICLCHSGYEWHEHALLMMMLYPQVHSDLAFVLWESPTAKRYAREFLSNAKDAGCLDRVMFGSDVGMDYSDHIKPNSESFAQRAVGGSIAYLNSLTFLSAKEKRDILYNNAVRFLKLDQ